MGFIFILLGTPTLSLSGTSVSEHQGHQAGISALAQADTHEGATLPLLA